MFHILLNKTRYLVYYFLLNLRKHLTLLTGIFLYKTLRHLNFGDNFIGYVKTMYNNIESTILNKGNTGIYFKLQRGVRQGCPLPTYLFITTLETLPNKIQNDSNIKDIKVDNNEIEISPLADDITLIVFDLEC